MSTATVGTLRERLAALLVQAGSLETVLSTLSALCSERAQGIRDKWPNGMADRIAREWVVAANTLHHAAKGVTV